MMNILYIIGTIFWVAVCIGIMVGIYYYEKAAKQAKDRLIKKHRDKKNV
ncbi:hypothetical protein [Piscirickettsia litoralis]|nr:hypothetical protein [Piscirickettsia litoralis]